MIIRGKKTLRTNTKFKLLGPRPGSFGCTPRKPVRHEIPSWAHCRNVAEYLACFSGRNNLMTSEFTINGQVIHA